MIESESLEQQETPRLYLNLACREMNWNCGWIKTWDKRITATKYTYCNFRLF